MLNTVTHKPAAENRQTVRATLDDVKFVEAIAFYSRLFAVRQDNAPAKISSPLTILDGDADDWTPAP